MSTISLSLNTRLFLVLCALGISTAAGADARTWSDRTGKFKIEAELVKFENDEVTLRKKDGKTVKLALAKLSADDQTYLKSQSKSEPKPKVDAPTNPKDIERVSKNFVKQLGAQDEAELRKVLVSRASDDDARSAIEKLDRPDRQSPSYVKKFEFDGDTAQANVSYRVKGKFQKHQVRFRFEESDWRISGIDVDIDNKEAEEQVTIKFGSESEEGQDETVSESDEEPAAEETAEEKPKKDE